VGDLVTLEAENGATLVFSADPELARAFGRRLYTPVIVQVLGEKQD